MGVKLHCAICKRLKMHSLMSLKGGFRIYTAGFFDMAANHLFIE